MKKMKKNNSRTEEARIENAAPENGVGQNEEVKIEPYAPHQTLGPADYQEPEAMKKLKASFEEQVTAFLDQTNPDQYNAGFADNIINKAMHEALIDLDKQRQNHIKTIERSIASLWKGDQHYYSQLLADNKAEYESCDRELRTLNAIYHRGTAFETLCSVPYNPKGGKRYE